MVLPGWKRMEPDFGVSDVLTKYVAFHNKGVRSGDFADLLGLFFEDAEMVFEGKPVGPFRGRRAIAKAFADDPPDDTLVILTPARGLPRDTSAVDYGWSKLPGTKAGELRATVHGGKIRRLVVTIADSKGRSSDAEGW